MEATLNPVTVRGGIDYQTVTPDVSAVLERMGDASYVMSDWAADPGPQPDTHPTDIGYRRIAWAFMNALQASEII